MVINKDGSNFMRLDSSALKEVNHLGHDLQTVVFPNYRQ